MGDFQYRFFAVFLGGKPVLFWKKLGKLSPLPLQNQFLFHSTFCTDFGATCSLFVYRLFFLAVVRGRLWCISSTLHLNYKFNWALEILQCIIRKGAKQCIVFCNSKKYGIGIDGSGGQHTSVCLSHRYGRTDI